MDFEEFMLAHADDSAQEFFKLLWSRHPYNALYPIGEEFFKVFNSLKFREQVVLIHFMKYTFMYSGVIELETLADTFKNVRELMSSIKILAKKKFIDSSDDFYFPHIESDLMYSPDMEIGIKIAYITENLVPECSSEEHLKLCFKSFSWICETDFSVLTKPALIRGLSEHLGVDEFTAHRVLQTLIESSILEQYGSRVDQNLFSYL